MGTRFASQVSFSFNLLFVLCVLPNEDHIILFSFRLQSFAEGHSSSRTTAHEGHDGLQVGYQNQQGSVQKQARPPLVREFI